jgi:processive 1,2-diacylglycerol beta-glucosyltransferase
MHTDNIAIYYLSMGSGHQVAAESLARAIIQDTTQQQVVAEDPFAKTIDILPAVFSALQTVSLLIAPDAYDLAWRRRATYDHYQWVTQTNILQDFLIDRLQNYGSDTVIATHVLPCLLSVGLKKRSIIKRLFGVITDFGANSLWPIEGVDNYFVATDELKNTLIYRGCEADTIHVTGIPIHQIPQPSFLRPTSSQLNVLFVIGGLRGGSYTLLRSYCNKLLDEIISSNLDITLTIVTGHQKQLQDSLNTYKQKTNFNLKIHGQVRDMAKLLMTNDILITKPGGLLISEALARGICIILTQPGPGQENANADFLARHGLAFNGEDPAKAANLLEYLGQHPKVVDQMKSAAKKMGHPESAQIAAKLILTNLSS